MNNLFVYIPVCMFPDSDSETGKPVPQNYHIYFRHDITFHIEVERLEVKREDLVFVSFVPSPLKNPLGPGVYLGRYHRQ